MPVVGQTIRTAGWRAGRDGLAHWVRGSDRAASVACGIPAWGRSLDGPRRARCLTCAELAG